LNCLVQCLWREIDLTLLGINNRPSNPKPVTLLTELSDRLMIMMIMLTMIITIFCLCFFILRPRQYQEYIASMMG
jgi:hypothetical protein